MKRTVNYFFFDRTPHGPDARVTGGGRRPGVVASAAVLLLLLFVAAAGGGCERNDMYNQPRSEPGEPSNFFADGQSDRPQPPGTVAQGQLVVTPEQIHRNTGMTGGREAATYPMTITRADLQRGRERYEIYCSVCHGATGTGDGMIVERGFVRPPSLHIDRLRAAPPGHVFRVITNGWGAMYSYNDRIAVDDRWRIAAYVQVLQLSQRAEMASLSPDERRQVEDTRALLAARAKPPQPAAAGGQPQQGQPQPQQGQGGANHE